MRLTSQEPSEGSKSKLKKCEKTNDHLLAGILSFEC